MILEALVTQIESINKKDGGYFNKLSVVYSEGKSVKTGEVLDFDPPKGSAMPYRQGINRLNVRVSVREGYNGKPALQMTYDHGENDLKGFLDLCAAAGSGVPAGKNGGSEKTGVKV